MRGTIQGAVDAVANVAWWIRRRFRRRVIRQLVEVQTDSRSTISIIMEEADFPTFQLAALEAGCAPMKVIRRFTEIQA